MLIDWMLGWPYFLKIRAWFVTKYKGVVCNFLQNKKEEKEEMGEGEIKGCLSGYNLNIIDGFTNNY